MSVGPLAPPRRFVAELSVKISTLCGTPASMLSNVSVNGVLARTARHFVSKPLAAAPVGAAIDSAVEPEGVHAAVGGGIDGWCRVGVGWARASPPVGEVASLRFR